MGKYPKPTKAEAKRIEVMMRLGCVHCAYFGKPVPAEECHHIVEGMKRLGHWYTLPLCRKCHARINQLTKSKEPSERELWERVQDRLHLPKVWVSTKILPRREVA
jgi:hypothetical protein